MPPTLNVYHLDGTLQGTLTPESATWQHRANEYGAGRATVNGDTTAALLGPQTYIRANDGTRDVFAFVPSAKVRQQSGRSTRVDLSGPGLRWLLSRCLVYPETDCRPVDVRWFGAMSAIYDDSSWSAPVSHGRHDQFVFGEGRGPGFADRRAELVSYTTSQSLTDTKFAHRAEFTLTDDTLVVIQAYGDDYYRTWLDSAPLADLETLQQPYNWKQTQQWSGKLCAGTHVLYFEVGNIDRTDVGNTTENPVYIAWSVMPAASDGQPQASHHAVNVLYSGTSGYWQGVVDGQVTAQIQWDATAAQIETAFNDVLGDGEVSVDGSTGSWTVTLDGPTYGYTPHAVSVDGTVSGLSLQTASYGASADYIAHSSASTGKVHEGAPAGLTFHEIVSALLAEEAARGGTPADHFTLSSTASLDTDGNTWGTLTLEVRLDNATIDRVIEMCIEAGVKVDVRPDLTIDGWVTRGTDRSATVVYTVGDGCTVVEAVNDQSPLVNVLRSLSEDGWAEIEDATSVSTYLRAGGTIRLDPYDEAGASQFTPTLLADLKDPQEPVTIELASSHTLQPYDDYDMGDTISVPTWGASGFATRDVKVAEIAGTLSGRSIIWTVRGNT